jgi:hypothetical protein
LFAQATHGIPRSGFKEATKDYQKVLQDIQAFTNVQEPMFFAKVEAPPIESSLKHGPLFLGQKVSPTPHNAPQRPVKKISEIEISEFFQAQ